jgi:hypothetical protein
VTGLSAFKAKANSVTTGEPQISQTGGGKTANDARQFSQIGSRVARVNS